MSPCWHRPDLPNLPHLRPWVPSPRLTALLTSPPPARPGSSPASAPPRAEAARKASGLGIALGRTPGPSGAIEARFPDTRLSLALRLLSPNFPPSFLKGRIMGLRVKLQRAETCANAWRKAQGRTSRASEDPLGGHQRTARPHAGPGNPSGVLAQAPCRMNRGPGPRSPGARRTHPASVTAPPRGAPRTPPRGLRARLPGEQTLPAANPGLQARGAPALRGRPPAAPSGKAGVRGEEGGQGEVPRARPRPVLPGPREAGPAWHAHRKCARVRVPLRVAALPGCSGAGGLGAASGHAP